MRSPKDEAISITLPATLPEGTQIVSYRVISPNSHPVTRSLTFSIGVPTANEAPDNDVGKVPLSVPGRWHMRIDALVADFKKITPEHDLDVTTR